MSSRFLFLLILASAPSLRAQTAPSASDPVVPAPPPGGAGATVTMEPFVISDHLDKDRDDIVPALGATQFSISPGQIAAQPLGGDAGFNQVLLRAPSMAQDSDGQLHLRGEHAELQYRINGVLLPEGLSGFGQELDPRFVQSLEVLTGSLPAQYGYRTAGIVDIRTQTGASLPDGGAVTAFGGSHDTERTDLELSGTQGRLSGFVTASVLQNDLGIENPTAATDALHDHTRQAKLFGDADLTLDSTSRLSVMASGSFATFQIPDNPGQAPVFQLAGVPGFDSAGLNENQREDNAYTIVSYQKTAGDFSGQFSAFSRYSLVKFLPDPAGDLIFNGVASRVHQDVDANGFESDMKWSLGATHTLRAGALVTADNANTRTADSVFPVDASGNPTSTIPLLIADDSHKLGWVYGVYAQDEWKPLSGLTINYGARADRSKGYLTESQLSPRLNASYKLGDSTTVHGGYARYFTPPPLELVQPGDLAKFAGTTNAPEVSADAPVRSERSHYFDVGISHDFTPDFSAALDGYDKAATDQLDEGQFGAAPIYAPFNYARGRIYGVELSADYTRKTFSAYVNLARSRAMGTGIISGQYQFSAEELAYIGAHDVHLDHDQSLTGSTGASWHLHGNLAYLDLLYGSGLRSGFANTDHLPEYHPLNIGFEHTFTWTRRRQLKARFDVVNVFDEVYALRDGSGIGVFAPQYGQRRGFYGSTTLLF